MRVEDADGHARDRQQVALIGYVLSLAAAADV
jgi:hypothetical protein